MTIEEVVAMDGDTLAALQKMNDDELKAHFSQFFPLTRPEMVRRAPSVATQAKFVYSLEEQTRMRQNEAKLKALGIDIDVSKQLKKKK